MARTETRSIDPSEAGASGRHTSAQSMMPPSLDDDLAALIRRACAQPGVREALELTDLATRAYVSTFPRPLTWDSSSSSPIVIVAAEPDPT